MSKFPKSARSKGASASSEISMDQSIKDLLTRYPVDAWRFLLPDLARKLGDPVSWEFLRSETRKQKKSRGCPLWSSKWVDWMRKNRKGSKP